MDYLIENIFKKCNKEELKRLAYKEILGEHDSTVSRGVHRTKMNYGRQQYAQ